jgi:signal transduction histidine kinase
MSSVKPAGHLSRRVFAVIALLLLAVSAVFTGYFLHIQRQRLEAAIRDRGKGLAGLLATGAKVAVYAENAELVQETLQGVVDRRDVLAAAVFTAAGAPVATAGRTPALKAAAAQLNPGDVALTQQLGANSGCLNHQDPGVIETYCPVLLRVRPESGAELYFGVATASAPITESLIGFVKVTIDRKPLQRELVSLVVRNLGLMLIVLLLCTGMAFRFSRRVTEPLEQLTEAVRAFGANGTFRELPRLPDDEIGRLAAAFTRMTGDIVERDREKERLSERLREAQKMEAVGTLSQGVAHDFKNILSTLKTAVHLLRKGAPDNEFVLKYAGKIQTSVDRAQDLVERLVMFSRTQRLETLPVELNALLAHLEPMLREAVGPGVHLELTPAPGPVCVLGDEGSLGQLLMNLAYNARDAMPGGGSLGIRLEAVPASESGAARARIVVRDTGGGMDAEVRRRMFEPFFTTKDVGGGMGLGLSIVRGIVEQHHGRIEVESEPGAGATFRVELPLAAEAAGRAARSDGDAD